jgi:hypothetical protein
MANGFHKHVFLLSVGKANDNILPTEEEMDSISTDEEDLAPYRKQYESTIDRFEEM